MKRERKGIFYTLYKVLSYWWAWLIVIIGARQRGKTYSCQKWLLNGWIKDKTQFAILRDTEAECEELCVDDGMQFWGDVLEIKKFSKLKITTKGTTIYIDGEVAGYVRPVSMFRKFKGTKYARVKHFLYDEFIREKGARYNGDRAIQFLNTLITMGSLRKDWKIILTANALDKGDTILCDVLKFNLDDFGIYKDRQRGIVLEYVSNNEDFEAYRASSNVYKLLKGTRFEDNLLDNKFADDNTGMFYTKRKPCDLYGIYYSRDNVAVRVYQSRDGEEWYCTRDTNPNTATYMRYTFDMKEKNHRIQYAGKDEQKFLQNLYKNNLIKFENSYILKLYKEIITM